MIIDCNKNKELASELSDSLAQYKTVQEDDKIVITDEITSDIIESHLKKINRPKHRVFLVEQEKFLIAIPQDLHDIGMDSCEFCGYVDYTDLVGLHRKSHQAL